jgi:hypothetical protein
MAYMNVKVHPAVHSTLELLVVCKLNLSKTPVGSTPFCKTVVRLKYYSIYKMLNIV